MHENTKFSLSHILDAYFKVRERLEHWMSTWKYGRPGSLGTGSTLI